MANYAVDSLQDGCYPGTAVLINTLSIRNQADLDAVEGTIVPAKAALWEEKPLAESFDFEHYCAIHRFLFEDLYEWAGKPRTVDIAKKGTQFCPAAQIESTSSAIFSRLEKQRFLVGLDRAHFISAIVDFYERTNELHGFPLSCTFYSFRVPAAIHVHLFDHQLTTTVQLPCKMPEKSVVTTNNGLFLAFESAV